MNKILKFVLQDYFNAFHWQKIKNAQTGNICLLFFTFILYPIISNIDDRSVAVELLLALPIFFTLMSAVLFPSVLPKQIYLCPMNKDMRRDYLTKARWVRSSIPILLSVVILTALTISGHIHWAAALGILANNSLLAVHLGAGINPIGYGSVNKAGIHQLVSNHKAGTVEVLAIFSCLIVAFIYSSTYSSLSTDTDGIILISVLTGWTLLVSLPLAGNYLKNWPEALENALSYETCCNRLAIVQKGAQKNG